MAITKQTWPMVAALDSAPITAEIQESCLRENEMLEAAAILNPLRRDEWVAGRIAAKYAFLCGEAFPESAGSGALHLQKLSSADLAAFNSEAYRSVSVVRNQAQGGGPASVGWSSSSDTMQVAISHSAGVSCASVGTSGVCSLDLESPAPRVPEFYLHTFTNREREWVSACAGACGLHHDWLYTLLWSARECLLKTPRFTALSLWNMPALEIEIREGVERLVKVYQSKDLSGSFELFEANTFNGPFRLAVAGAPNLILTAITQLG
jgi:4'-phosphopantetheinyl transferase EntD